MEQFFLPYLRFMYGAAYNVQQILEGIGVLSSSFLTFDNYGNINGSYWSPSEAATLPLIFIFLYLPIMLTFLFSASYTIGKKKGVGYLVLILILPGILSYFEYWPNFNYLPGSYDIGGNGELGSVLGFLPLVVFGILTGWSIVILIYDNFNLNDKFRHIFDHFWYTSAVIAGAFFIIDSGVNKNVNELKEENSRGRQASSYLLNQVKIYDSHCSSTGSKETLSCRWASDVQQYLTEYTVYDEKLFYSLGPKSTQDIYDPIWKKLNRSQILILREQISSYNNKLCPFKQNEDGSVALSRSSGVCQRVPAVFCRSYPEEHDKIVNKNIALHTVALASECIAPTIVLSRRKQESLVAKVKQDTYEKYLRWIYFVLFSFIIGGKLANSTTKLFGFDNRPKKERLRILRVIYSISTTLVKALKYIFELLLHAILSISKSIYSMSRLIVKKVWFGYKDLLNTYQTTISSHSLGSLTRATMHRLFKR